MKLPLRACFALFCCKFLRFISRLLRRGGTAMPGRFAVRICPDLLSYLAKDVETVAVTGTNGKTTCSRMIEEAFDEAGFSYFTNRSGANLMSGITTEFAMNASISGKMQKKYAVIECDEAAAAKVFYRLQPKVIVVTNLFRDQLDRYGEITHTLSNIETGIRDVPDATLCLNADCSLTASLSLKQLPNPVVWYGIDASAKLPAVPAALSDASHCMRCKAEYVYDYHTYAHLGGFRCPRCGYRRHEADYAISGIYIMDDRHSDVLLRTPAGESRLIINLPASYNLYNAVASICAAEAMGVSSEICRSALGKFSCGFGRLEDFGLAGGTKMILVKNPAGCSQALEFICSTKKDFILVVCLNDRGADGTDISWIWDANFELLQSVSGQIHHLIVSGDRADDMRIRMKYAGFPDEIIRVEYSTEKLVSSLVNEALPVFIIPTYTAMLDLRGAIVRRFGGSQFWE